MAVAIIKGVAEVLLGHCYRITVGCCLDAGMISQLVAKVFWVVVMVSYVVAKLLLGRCYDIQEVAKVLLGRCYGIPAGC